MYKYISNKLVYTKEQLMDKFAECNLPTPPDAVPIQGIALYMALCWSRFDDL